MQPMLKAPELKRLKLNLLYFLSNFAFNFNVRRYNQAKHQAKTGAPRPKAIAPPSQRSNTKT